MTERCSHRIAVWSPSSSRFRPLLFPSLIWPGHLPLRTALLVPGMALVVRRRTVVRVLIFAGLALLVKLLIASPTDASVAAFYGAADPKQIRKQNVLDLVTRSDKQLDARKHEFLQVRMGRDERPDLFSDLVNDGVQDYWERFQKP